MCQTAGYLFHICLGENGNRATSPRNKMNAQILLVISVAVLQLGLVFAGAYHPSYDRYVKYGIDYWWKREKEFLKQWQRPPPKPINCPTPPMNPPPGPPGVGPTPPGPQVPGTGPKPPQYPGNNQYPPQNPQYPGNNQYPSQYPGYNQSPSSSNSGQYYKPPPKPVASRPVAKSPARGKSKSKPYRG